MAEYTLGSFVDHGWTWGNGSSQHTTTQNGAAFSFSFEGTTIWLFGTATNMTYTVAVDGNSASFAYEPGVLAMVSGLSPGQTHILDFETSQNGDGSELAFEKAVFNVPTGFVGGGLSNETIQSLDILISYNGFQPVYLEDATGNFTVYESQLANDMATYNFMGEGIWVYGMLNYDHGFYEVALDNDGPRRLNGQSKYAIQDSLLYYKGGLDPSVTHTLAITNLENKPFDLGYIRVVGAVNGTQVSGSPGPMAEIIAVAVAGSVLSLLFVFISLCLLVRRLRRYPGKSKSVDLTEAGGPTIDPYPSRKLQRPTVIIPGAKPQFSHSTTSATSSEPSASTASPGDSLKKSSFERHLPSGYWKGGVRFSTRVAADGTYIVVTGQAAYSGDAPPEYRV